MNSLMSGGARYLLIFLTGVVVGGASTNRILTLRSQADIAMLNNAQSQALKALSDNAAASGEAARQREHHVQQQLAALDAQYQQEIDNGKGEAQRLRTDLERGRRRMQLAIAALATCEQLTGAVSGAGGLGNAGAVKLSATAGRNIQDIRNGIQEDRIRLSYLQAYIRELQAQGVIAAADGAK